MSSHFQQHLDSRNMRMIDRALARVRTRHPILPGSAEESRVAASMVREFQKGNTTEEGLSAVFFGDSDPDLHSERQEEEGRSSAVGRAPLLTTNHSGYRENERVAITSDGASGGDSKGDSLVPMLVGGLVLIFLGSIIVMTFV